MMDKKQVSIATITWARDAAEDELLRAALTSLAALEIPVFIADGGSGPAFTTFLQSFPHFTLVHPAGRGLWAQAQASLRAAYAAQSPYICYTEPDKGAFFREGLAQFLRAACRQHPPGVVLAARSAAGFATFPAFQQATETAINHCCAEVVGLAVDYTYGPFLLQRELVAYLDLATEDLGWGWRPFLFGLAQRLGYPVSAREGDYTCPPDQQADSRPERLYRMRQLSQNIQGLVLAATVPVQAPLP